MEEKEQRERESTSEQGKAGLCSKRNMMLKKADRQKTSLSVVAMVTVPSVFLPTLHQKGCITQ